MTCLTCKHWQPRNNPAMAKNGWAACKKGPAYEFLPLTGNCKVNAPASAEDAAKRIAWAKKAGFRHE